MVDPLFIEPIHEEYKFPSERDLENFVWSNLEQLLQVSPFKRQYICRNEICDILATNEQKQLVILELKNSENRYIVQQLTRYYNNLVNEKPFTGCIDWEKQIQLIATALS